MNILVTGANGFIGKNLVTTLKNIKDGKDITRPNLLINEIYEYDLDTDSILLDEFCKNVDFVFNFAGVNRTNEVEEFINGNYLFAKKLLMTLKKYNNKCPVMLASSIQASLSGRFCDSEYGKSKQKCENLFFKYGEDENIKVLVYRFTNVFGKWCNPNYNSVIATFCYNIANDLDIFINDKSVILELTYIDDLVFEMLNVLEEKDNNYLDNNKYYTVPKTYKKTVGEIANILLGFKQQNKKLFLTENLDDSFIKKLYSTYLSYIPQKDMSLMLSMDIDERGSFSELFKTNTCGQISINISKPGITKGQHWHQSKLEIFIVISGYGLIQERKIGTDEVISFEVSGEQLEAIYILPGYTHSITNLSSTDNLVTVIWANEVFDKRNPDTFFEVVC